jgi:hypothetical protein
MMSRFNIMNRFQEARHWRDPLQFLDMVTTPWIPGNWYNPTTRTFNNPLQAFGLDRFFSRPGQPLPPFMQPNAPMPGQQPYTGPGSPGWRPDVPGQQPQGQGPLMSYQRPPQRRPGPGGGRTIASRGNDTTGRNPAAQMFEGMRDSANRNMTQQQARNAMQRSFGNAEE